MTAPIRGADRYYVHMPCNRLRPAAADEHFTLRGTTMQFDHTWGGIFGGSAYPAFDADPRPLFEPEAASFHVGTAWWLSELARVIYRRELLEVTLKRAGFEVRHHADEDGAGCLVVSRVGERPACTVVAFRGCTDLRSWLAALGVAPAQWGEGLVHGGFARVAERLWSPLEPVLRDVPRPLLFAGHSSGGVAAALAASRVRPSAVYTFGAPRFADEAFIASLSGVAVYRVVNQSDLIAALPSGPLPYRHAGTRYHIDGRGHINRSEGEAAPWYGYRIVRHALGQLLALSRWPAPPEPLAHHAPINYSAWLERIATQHAPVTVAAR